MHKETLVAGGVLALVFLVVMGGIFLTVNKKHAIMDQCAVEQLSKQQCEFATKTFLNTHSTYNMSESIALAKSVMK